MVTHTSRKPAAAASWPRKIRLGRVTVTVYRRRTPLGNHAFMVANYAQGRRRFDSYANEGEALDAAQRLARQLSEREVVAASMTNEQAADYAAAVQTLAPFNLSLPATAGTVAECLKLVDDLPNLHAAAKFYAARHKQTTRKLVADAVTEFLAVKENRRASARYLQDLRFRLGRFADAFHKDTVNVTTAEIQAWFDVQKLAPQSYTNFRRVLHAFFGFAVARGYAVDNPVAGVENPDVPDRDVAIYTPAEVARLLAAAAQEFLPCVAMGAFAGLRSAEIERLDWEDIDLAGRNITIGADKAKTASRRVVPIADNLAAWLAPYAACTGALWTGGDREFYKAQQATAERAGIKWKPNALRHSYASYRFALTGDAGRVAGELGNSAAVVHRHYRELVKPAAAERWFAVKPEAPANVVQLAAKSIANE